MSAESDNNRTKLLRAAAELFANKGFDAVSTRDLCNHASVNVAAISYYFGGKEGLYLEVFEANARRVSEKTRAVLKNHEGKVNSKESLAAALTDFIGVIVDLRIQEPEVSIVLQKQSIGNIPGVHEAVVKIMGPLGDEVTHFQELPTFLKVFEAISTPNKLKALAEKTGNQGLKNWAKHYAGLPPTEVAQRTSGLTAALSHFAFGKTSALFNTESPSIDLDNALRENQIVYFQLPVMLSPFLGKATGKMILQCLQSAVANRHCGENRNHTFYSVFLGETMPQLMG